MEVQTLLHPEVVADLTTTSDVFSSKWYSKYLRSNPWVKYQKENHILYSGGIGHGGYIEIDFTPERGYCFYGFTSDNRKRSVLLESHDWEKIKKKVDEFFEMYSDILKPKPQSLS